MQDIEKFSNEDWIVVRDRYVNIRSCSCCIALTLKRLGDFEDFIGEWLKKVKERAKAEGGIDSVGIFMQEEMDRLRRAIPVFKVVKGEVRLRCVGAKQWTDA